MSLKEFIVVGENIHCTRVLKRGGTRAAQLPDGGEGVSFTCRGEDRVLPVPAGWGDVSPAFNDGKIKHVALAIHQVLNGDEAARRDGTDYLCFLAERQINAGTTYLDVNVDEYSSDAKEAAEVMSFLAAFYAERYDTPLSIDSSDPDILRAGLEAYRGKDRPPMINSVSLERVEAIELVVAFGADVIVNAVGRTGMPCGVEDRLENFREIVGLLDGAGVPRNQMHLDPLVFPISTDPMNGGYVLGATAAAKAALDGVHFNGGLSNISFGMPNRKLLNMTFTYLCAEVGTDGGIIDPVSMPVAAIAALDPESESFQFAKAVLTGEDMFGMEYISAFREGRLG